MLPLCPYIHKFRFGISPVSEVPVVVLPVGGNRHPAHGSDANWKQERRLLIDVTETIPIIIIIITNDCWAHRYWTAEIFSEEGGITVGRGLSVIWTKDLSVTGPHPSRPPPPPHSNPTKPSPYSSSLLATTHYQLMYIAADRPFFLYWYIHNSHLSDFFENHPEASHGIPPPPPHTTANGPSPPSFYRTGRIKA